MHKCVWRPCLAPAPCAACPAPLAPSYPPPHPPTHPTHPAPAPRSDYQRHLPYIWAAPAFEINKFRKYTQGQYPDGHIPEYLGSFGISPLDQTGGRTMADTTSLYITELYEFLIGTGNATLVA